MTLQRLQELVHTLDSLLSSPEPGLFTWHIAVGETMKELISEWFSNHVAGPVLKEDSK